MSEPAWHEPEPGAKDAKLHRTKMKCGCWTYYQRGADMGIFTLMVMDSCDKDHELAVGPYTPRPGEPPRIKLETSTEMRETQLETPAVAELPKVREN